MTGSFNFRLDDAAADASIELWLPPQLARRMRQVAKKIEMSPLTFLKKAVELHMVRSDSAPVSRRKYLDEATLQDAYGLLQLDEDLYKIHQTDQATYLRQLEAGENAAPTDPNSHDEAFTATVIINPELKSSIVELVGGETSEVLDCNIKRLGIIATHELVTAYDLVGLSGNAD